MASSTTLSTVFSKDVVFDDLTSLNEKLRTLMEDWDEFEDGKPILDFKDGKLLFRGFEEDEPVAVSEVWASWTLTVSRLVARHISAGRLVLKLDHEYGKQEYHVLSNGQAVKVNEAEDWAAT